MKTYRGNGKFLLTGEYVVLDGAEVVALPTKLGQTMTVSETSGADINWTSYNPDNSIWFEGVFSLYDLKAHKTTDALVSDQLAKIFKACARQDSEFLSQWKGQKIKTNLEFDRNWGLGSSSTMIHCIALWADLNPYQLLMDTFGGSGYDIACAAAKGPIWYQLDDTEIYIDTADFKPKFKDQLHFVYLGTKQNSQIEVEKYKLAKTKSTDSITKINDIGNSMISAKKLEDFMVLMNEHESIISALIGRKKVKDEMFSDFEGAIKSLGAWGGDFVLAASPLDSKFIKEYFNKKGHSVVFSYDEIIL